MALPGANVVTQAGQSYVVQGTSTSTAYASGIAAGTKGIDCQSWSQIEGAMQQKFPSRRNRTENQCERQPYLMKVPTNTPIAAMSNHGLSVHHRTMPS